MRPTRSAVGNITSTAIASSASSPLRSPAARAHLLDEQDDAPRVGENRLTRLGQHRPAPPPLEQPQAELRFEIGDGVAKDGLRAVESARGGREAAAVHHRDKHPELLERGGARDGHIENFDPSLRSFPHLLDS